MEESFEAEIPEDMEEATDAMDETFVSYVDSRRRMRELALARGFYPVMAIGPEFDRGGRGKGEGRPKGKEGHFNLVLFFLKSGIIFFGARLNLVLFF